MPGFSQTTPCSFSPPHTGSSCQARAHGEQQATGVSPHPTPQAHTFPAWLRTRPPCTLGPPSREKPHLLSLGHRGKRRRRPPLFTVPMGLQVRLEPAQQRDPVAGLPLQGPVAVQPLHELTLPLEGQAVGDLAEPAGREGRGQPGSPETERRGLSPSPPHQCWGSRLSDGVFPRPASRLKGLSLQHSSQSLLWLLPRPCPGCSRPRGVQEGLSEL